MPERIYDEPNLDHAAQRLRSPATASLLPGRTTPRRDRTRLLAFLLIGLGVAMLLGNLQGGASGGAGFGRTRTYGVDVPRKGATTAQLHIEWASGPLRLATGGGGALVRGSVEAGREPHIDVDDDDDTPEVTVDGGNGGFFGSSRAAAGMLLLDPEVRYRIAFDLGSGRAELDLRDVRVEELEIEARSGDVELALPAGGAARATIEAGSGAFAIILPPGAEARFLVDGDDGEFNPGERLRRVEGDDGDHVYETPGYSASPAAIEVELDAGSGNITVR